MSESIRALAHVQREIEKLRQEQVEYVADGRATAFEEYNRVCGVIRGLNLADSIINDLVRKVNEDD